MAAIVAEFDLKLAPGYLENLETVDCEKTPRYASTLMHPMVISHLPTLLLQTYDCFRLQKDPLLVTVARRKTESG